MTQTVIGIFDTDIQAQAAVDALVAANFNREDIYLALNDTIRGRGDVTDEKHTQDSEVANFFRKIFDNDAGAAQRYAAVAQQGALLVLHANTFEEATTAAAVMDAAGAIDVNERASILEDSWTRQDRTSGEGNPDVKVFPGIAEYDSTGQPDQNLTRVDERIVSTGNVRVRSQIVDRPAGPNIRVREERLNIEPRTPNRVGDTTGAEIREEDNA